MSSESSNSNSNNNTNIPITSNSMNENEMVPELDSTSRLIPFIKIINQPCSFYRMRSNKSERTRTNSNFIMADNFLNNNINLKGDEPSTSQHEACSSNMDFTTGDSASKSKLALKKKTKLINDGKSGDIYPKIEIVNGQGPATLIVSCVNKDQPYHVHPHRLVGECCKSGVAVLNIIEGEKYFDLIGISIEYVKSDEIEESINELKNKNVDPFNEGFTFERSTLDLNQLRLCFQVYLRDSLETNDIIRDHYHILAPLVSNVITNVPRLHMSTSLSSGLTLPLSNNIQIIRAVNMYSPVNGGQTVCLFLKKLEKDQKIIFAKFFDQNGWCKDVKINESSIHNQVKYILFINK
jgi:hypothetical protein